MCICDVFGRFDPTSPSISQITSSPAAYVAGVVKKGDCMVEKFEQRFLELAERSEELKRQQKEVRNELEQVMLQLGVGHVIKDNNGIVWRIQEYSGQFVYPQVVEFVRTKKEGETKGTLSKKEADELCQKLGL